MVLADGEQLFHAAAREKSAAWSTTAEYPEAGMPAIEAA